nr:MAG TPA: hypothetical protein [Caudoviricetes sp.]
MNSGTGIPLYRKNKKSSQDIMVFLYPILP